MKQQVFLIQPLNQLIIRDDILSRPSEWYSLDALDEDLKFKKELANTPASKFKTEWLEQLIQSGKVKPTGWVVVTADDNAPVEELWKMAMAALPNNQTEHARRWRY